MSLEKELAKLEQATAEKREQLTREYAIREQLGAIVEGYRPPFIHFYKLYGRRGSIRFAPERYSSLQKSNEQQPNADLLRALLQAFPPLPAVRVKDGCTSFRPDLGESYSTENRPADEYECYGVIVRVETSQDQTARLEWTAQLGEELWEFEFEIPWCQTDFGALTLRAKRDTHGRVIRWEECSLRPNHNAQVIRWASGSWEYPNSFTLYWDRDSGAALDFPVIAFGKMHNNPAIQML